MAKIFISAVSAEFEKERTVLASDLKRPGLVVRFQEEFVANGRELLFELNDYIKECDATICIVGSQTGQFPADDHRNRFIDEEVPDIEKTLNLDKAFLDKLSYTQWEAWLTHYHSGADKRMLIAAPDNITFEITIEDNGHRLQSKHVQRLADCGRIIRIRFENPDRLSVQVYRCLYEILPDSAFQQIDMLPRSLKENFRGRDTKLFELAESVHRTEDTVNDAQRVVLTGGPGYGKTQLAVEFAHIFAQRYKQILYVSLGGGGDFRQIIASLCTTIAKGVSDKDSLQSRYEEVHRSLRSAHGPEWLLILDNVDDLDDQKQAVDFSDKLRGGTVIMTSRIRNWPHGYTVIGVETLDVMDAVEYLLGSTKSGRLENQHAEDLASAEEIVKQLAMHPLALAQASAFISAKGLSLEEFKSILDEPDAFTVLERNFSSTYCGYPESVTRAWMRTYDAINAQSKFVFDVLCWLSPDPIPEDIFTKRSWPELAQRSLGASRWSCAADGIEENRRWLLDDLRKFSVISRRERHGTLMCSRMHGLLQKFGRDSQAASISAAEADSHPSWLRRLFKNLMGKMQKLFDGPISDVKEDMRFPAAVAALALLEMHLTSANAYRQWILRSGEWVRMLARHANHLLSLHRSFEEDYPSECAAIHVALAHMWIAEREPTRALEHADAAVAAAKTAERVSKPHQARRLLLKALGVASEAQILAGAVDEALVRGEVAESMALELLKYAEVQSEAALEAVDVIWWVGTVLQRLSRHEEAIEKFTTALRCIESLRWTAISDEFEAEGWRQLARIRESIGESQGKIGAYRDAVLSIGEADTILACMIEFGKQEDEALQSVATSLEYARALFSAGLVDEALLTFKTVIRNSREASRRVKGVCGLRAAGSEEFEELRWHARDELRRTIIYAYPLWVERSELEAVTWQLKVLIDRGERAADVWDDFCSVQLRLALIEESLGNFDSARRHVEYARSFADDRPESSADLLEIGAAHCDLIERVVTRLDASLAWSQSLASILSGKSPVPVSVPPALPRPAVDPSARALPH